MQQQRNQPQFFQVPPDNLRPMRTWGELVVLSERNKKITELLTACITRGNETDKEEAIKLLVKGSNFNSLLAISENSPLIKDFLKQEKYASIWQKLIDQNHNDYTDYTINLNPFDRLMGFYIAYEFEAWILEERHQFREARILGEKARIRGMDINSLIQDSLPQLPIVDEIGLIPVA